MKAVGSFIIVKDNEVIQENELGLIVTEQADKNIRYVISEVVTCGADVKEVHSGQFVYYDKISGSELRVKGKRYICIRERDVVVTMNDADSSI
tara:strand:+ start:771 stop:1049 length:279 start_codon:yes stop_codon:yes gene_type:complete